MTIEEAIDRRIGEVRTEALDLSFGEIASLYAAKELIIQPEYQRLFRWTDEQRSRLIESVLLELPVPPIFVIETADGVYELIDGLQRLCSIIQFMDPEALELDKLELVCCDLVKELNKQSFDQLPLKLRLRLKRSAIRTIVIKRQSSSFLRYEMFKRLNTGGSGLEPQEIRNCTARMIGESGVRFYKFLQDCASTPCFVSCTDTLSDSERVRKGDEELVLRYFALKNAQELFRGNVRDWLDDYMEHVLLDQIEFDYASELADFELVFNFLDNAMGDGAFVRYRGNNPTGGLASAYYEAVTGGTFRARAKLPHTDPGAFRHGIVQLVQSPSFRDVTGPGANSREKLETRVELVASLIRSLS